MSQGNGLVLTRREGESVIIGTAEVKVLSIKGNKVKLGLNADRSIPILRSELPPREVQETSAA